MARRRQGDDPDAKYATGIDCARAHVEPSKPRSKTCAGLRFHCPTCDERCVLSKIDMLVLIKGTPLQAFGCFDFKVDALEWMNGETFNLAPRKRIEKRKRRVSS